MDQGVCYLWLARVGPFIGPLGANEPSPSDRYFGSYEEAANYIQAYTAVSKGSWIIRKVRVIDETAEIIRERADSGIEDGEPVHGKDRDGSGGDVA